MKKLSFRSTDQKIWFVSDLHLGHAKEFILDPRGYGDVQHALAHTWQTLEETVGYDDIVFNLGDGVVGAQGNTLDYAKRLMRLPCKYHFYLWGNHNAGVQQLYDEIRQERGILADNIEMYPLEYPNSNFVFMGHRIEVFIDGTPVVLDHYPIASWNHLSKGGYNIHGHCHRNLNEDLTLKRIDVGWDWKRRPVEWNEIVRELANRKSVAPDHHGAGV